MKTWAAYLRSMDADEAAVLCRAQIAERFLIMARRHTAGDLLSHDRAHSKFWRKCLCIIKNLA